MGDSNTDSILGGGLLGQLLGKLKSKTGPSGANPLNVPPPSGAAPLNPAQGRVGYDWTGLGATLPLAGQVQQPNFTTAAPSTSGDWWKNWKPGMGVAPGAPGTPAIPGATPPKTSGSSKPRQGGVGGWENNPSGYRMAR